MPPDVDTSGFWVFSLWRFPRFGKIYHDLTAEEKAAVMELRDQGESLHNSGQHQEAVDTLAKALEKLGIK